MVGIAAFVEKGGAFLGFEWFDGLGDFAPEGLDACLSG